jgi:hypothetical protein
MNNERTYSLSFEKKKKNNNVKNKLKRKIKKIKREKGGKPKKRRIRV